MAVTESWDGMAPYDPGKAVAQLRTTMDAAGVTIEELRFAYLSVGGRMTKSQLIAVLGGLWPLSEFQYWLLSQALNEHFQRAEPFPRAV